jgi:hypothetical protein
VPGRDRDDLDSQVEESLVDLLELARAPDQLVRDDRLDLLVQQIALVLPLLEEDRNLRILFLD